MPKIPVITATPGAAVPQSPNVISFQAPPDIGPNVTELGGRLALLGTRLSDQQAELEQARMVGDYEAGIKDIRLRLDQDPATQESPDAYAKLFQESVGDLQEQISATGKTDLGRRLFSGYVRRKLPTDLVDAKAQGIRLFTAGQIAILGTVENSLAKQAVEAPDQNAKATIMQQHDVLVERAAQRGLISGADAVKLNETFRTKVDEGTMAFLAINDRPRLRQLNQQGAFGNVDPAKRVNFMHQANRLDEHEEAQLRRQHAETEQTYFFTMLGLANRGEASNAVIENGLAGLDPVLKDPQKWKVIASAQNDPPVMGSALALRVIMSEYSLTTGEIADIDRALGALQQLVADNGPTKQSVAFGEKLQSDRRTILRTEAFERGEQRAIVAAAGAVDARARAVENQQRSQREDAKNIATDDYLARVGPMPRVDPLDRERKRRAAELAEIRDMINRGTQPRDAVNIILERRKSRFQAVPDSSPQAPGTPRTDKDKIIEELLK